MATDYEPFIPVPGDSLEESVAHLCSEIEKLAAGSRTGICIVSADRSMLLRAVFPNLPASFQAAIHEIPLGPPYFANCTAAMDGHRIVTTHDMTKEARFDERFVAHCVRHSIRALRSRPIFDQDNKPLGTFVMGFMEPRHESDFDAMLMEFAADATAALLQREHQRTANSDGMQ